MEATKEPIDSEILGQPVLAITGFDRTHDFDSFEREYRSKENPIYITCKVPVEDIAGIHFLEDHGFRFVEFQVQLRGTLNKTYDTSAYDYEFTPVAGEEDLDAVKSLASIFVYDRINRDPFFQQFGGHDISGERYRRYLTQSMRRADEFVYKLVSNATGEIVGFSSHRLLSPESALLLIGGVKSEYKSAGVGAINDYFALNELKRKGVKWFLTNISGANYPIFNLEVRGLGFRVLRSLVVLRKTYQASPNGSNRAPERRSA
jgi:hypothetical protein